MMRFCFTLGIILSFLNLSLAQTGNSLIGQWQLESFVCENDLKPSSQAPTNPFLNLAQRPQKTFFASQKFSDTIYIPIGADTTCMTQGHGHFEIKNHRLLVHLTQVTSPDCPAFVEGFNAGLEDNNLFENEFKIPSPNTLFIYQELKNGETDFSCGKQHRVVEIWKKL